MNRDPAFLLDMAKAARRALSYVAGNNEVGFTTDARTQDAVIRCLEIIGEAARRLKPETRASLPGVPWKSIIAMRNVMSHEYDEVDLAVIWGVVQRDLPELLRNIEPLIPPDEA